MKIAVSACLLGEACRFDGASKPCEAVMRLASSHELIPICPEVAGGLPVPHPPCEIVANTSELRVIDANDVDQTAAFQRGAQATVERITKEGCALAILKANSPSCGSGLVYDGTFTKTLLPGFGVAARAIKDAGIRVIDETQVSQEFAR